MILLDSLVRVALLGVLLAGAAVAIQLGIAVLDKRREDRW